MKYKKCLVEVDEVLGFLIDEDKNKIPLEVRNNIAQVKDKKYIWKYDYTKPLVEQNLNRLSMAILSYLNMEYIATKEQKELLKDIYEYNEKKKRNVINATKVDTINDLQEVLKKGHKKIEITENKEELGIEKVTKDGIFQKMITKLKKLFKRK